MEKRECQDSLKTFGYTIFGDSEHHTAPLLEQGSLRVVVVINGPDPSHEYKPNQVEASTAVAMPDVVSSSLEINIALVT